MIADALLEKDDAAGLMDGEWHEVTEARQLGELQGHMVRFDAERFVTGLVVGEESWEGVFPGVSVLLARSAGQRTEGFARVGMESARACGGPGLRVRVLPFDEAVRLTLSFGQPNPYRSRLTPLDPDSREWQTFKSALELEPLGGKMVEFDTGASIGCGVALLRPGVRQWETTGGYYMLGLLAVGPGGYTDGDVTIGDDQLLHGLRVRVLPPEEAATHTLSGGEPNPYAKVEGQ